MNESVEKATNQTAEKAIARTMTAINQLPLGLSGIQGSQRLQKSIRPQKSSKDNKKNKVDFR